MEQNLLPFQRPLFTPDSVARGARDEAPVHELVRRTDADGVDFAFGVLDAHRIKLSHLYDKLSSLSNSRTRLLPHQIEATHIVASALRPRFILADEVGLGKTVEAGLVIKELLFRKGYSRVLICTPAPLTIQWQQELKNKFNEEFDLLNRRNFVEMSSAWAKHPRLLTSVDFIKNPRYGDEILKARWDIVVFDEAHRLRRDYSKVTHAYAFAEKIAQKCEALLLLSATPFRGKLEELYFLVRLVDPHLLGPFASFMQEYGAVAGDRAEAPESRRLDDLRTKISRVMLRRRKVEVGGFTKRHAVTIRFDLGTEERAFYDEMTDYVRREYNLAMREQNRAVSFIMIVFQKLLDSSTRALLRALEKRKTMLEQNLFGSRAALARYETARADFIQQEPAAEALFEESDDPESDLDALEEDSARKTLKDLRKEILTLNFLIKLGRSVKTDRKLIKLCETMEKLKREGHPKYVIFTQFRTTQDYLAENLRARGFKVSVFHGSLNLVEKEEAIQEFRESTDALICTEAGGEGRNLQFANILINYDLPWSPLKIEQRIGRVHRFGQTRDVYIFNFTTRDTVAERVLEVLERKIKLFEEAIGVPDTLLGAMEDELDFQNTLMSFISGRKTAAEMDQEIEAKIKISDSAYRKLGELVTPQCLDFDLTDYYQFTQEQRGIDNQEIERLCLKYQRLGASRRFTLTAGEASGGDAGGARLLAPSRSGAEEPAFAAAPPGEYVLADLERKSRRPATFRSELALERDFYDFLAVGHPFVDEALAYFLEHAQRRTLQALRLPGRRGIYFVFVCQYRNGLSRAELLSCFVSGARLDQTEIPRELLIPPGAEAARFRPRRMSAAIDALDSLDPGLLKAAAERALVALQAEAERRAGELKDSLHSVFKKEEYKLEISYGKKVRQLEERLDQARLRARMEPNAANRALTTRIENELLRARHEREQRVHRVRRDSRVDAALSLLQAYVVNEE